MKQFKFLSREEEKGLTKEELKNYYLSMRKFYENAKKSNDIFYKIIHRIYQKIARSSRTYDLIVRGYDNIPEDDNCIFAFNHSNTHDFYNLQECLNEMFYTLNGKDANMPILQLILSLGGCIFIDRRDKKSSFNGANQLIAKCLSGNNIAIFPEGTWNISPSKPLLPFHNGVIKIAQKTGKPIVPVVMEYIETDDLCDKEKDIITKCVFQVCKPIYVSFDDSISDKLEELREVMSTVTWNIWEEEGMKKREDFDFNYYQNHSNLKMKIPLFEYKYQDEEHYIYDADNYIYKEYPVNYVKVKK